MLQTFRIRGLIRFPSLYHVKRENASESKNVLRKKRSSLHKCDFELWIFGMFILRKAAVSFLFFA